VRKEEEEEEEEEEEGEEEEELKGITYFNQPMFSKYMKALTS
jgi:hypothetical protein